jgi:succinate-semialdehyde dehydrogenase / glutarate-semialdehyde dehydrogenase
MTGTIELRDPRTGESDGTIAATTREELATAAVKLRAAQPTWNALGVDGRADALRHWKTACETRRDDIITALAADTGRMRESIQEFDAFLGTIERWATLAPKLFAENRRFTSTLGFIDIDKNLRPYQLAGIISPWNFPLVLSTIDALPALMAGTAVLLKPSEVTPRFVVPIRDALRDVPELASVFEIAIGDGSVGAQMIPLVDLICFTGSVPTGRKVGAAAAAQFIPAFLELGGKDPAIVLAGADLDHASTALLWGATSNAGQACQSIERIYVDASVHDEFVDLLSRKAARIGLCFPTYDTPGLGPIIAERQVPTIERHLADAQAKGAVVTAGSTEVERHGGGAWVRITVLTGVTHDMEIMSEETFGPFLPVMAVADADEAVRLANDSPFGLSAAVFAATTDEAEAVARRLDAGAVSVNDSTLTALVWEGEKHSFKSSGLGGSRMGPASLFRFLRSQALLVKTNTAVRDPWWYPAELFDDL